jgi:hypothetical protein
MNSRTLDDQFCEVGIKQAILFRSDPETYKKCLVSGGSIRGVMTEVYKSLLANNRAKGIESLPEGEKQNLWNMAKELAEGRLSYQETINLAKALYALEILLNTI